MDLITIHKRRTETGPSSLHEPGAILLISCYELGHQPAGVAQPLGFLEQAGYAPAAMDIAVEPLDPERVRRASFIGISVPMHTALRLGVRTARLVRQINPSSHICFYGLYASLNAEYLLEHVADSVIGGEYETPLVRLVQALDRTRPLTSASSQGREQTGKGTLPAIEGVSVRGRLAEPFLKRSPLPFAVPKRSGLPALERYARLERDGGQQVVGYVEASRGCLHSCLHCPIVPVYEGRFFVVPQEVVLADIRQQVQAGATHITFGDPDFLNGPGHSLSIVRAMHAEFPALTFDFTAKIEHLLKRRALFPELADLGCLFVISAVESFSDVVLAHLQKGHTRTDVLTVLESLRSAGITLRPSLVAFTPWTTLDDYLEMFEIIEAYDLIDAVDPVQYTVRLLVPPGSALLDRDDRPDSIRRFLSGLDQAGFQHRWMHPDPRMDRLHQEATALVEEAAKIGEDPAETFDRLRALAHRIAGRPLPATSVARTRPPERRRPPRLTEPWFCCAEPTQEQFVTLQTPGHWSGSL